MSDTQSAPSVAAQRERWRRRLAGGLAAAVMIVPTACEGGAGTATSVPSATSANADLSARLHSVITDALRDLSIPGAVVLVRSPGGEYAESFGTRDLATGERTELDDHFRVGSITKTMTGTVVLQLVQEARIALSDPVSKYRSDVPDGDHITIAELLDMRSGLYNYTELPSFQRSVDEDRTKIWRPEELLALAVTQPLYFPPGQGFHYSNTNAVLLGLIVEQVTGQRLDDVLRQRIFTPLGLHDTLLPLADDNTIPTPHPRGYMFGTVLSTSTDPMLPPAQRAAAYNGTLLPTDVTDLSPSQAWAAGGVISTATDLADYAKSLVGGDLLHADLQRQRLDSLVPVNPQDPRSPSYGLALTKSGSLIGHDGLVPGYQSFIGVDPDRKITVVVLTNLSNAPDGRPTADFIAESIASML
jgi:D-alanyl-D-alanine carboxypeptidase